MSSVATLTFGIASSIALVWTGVAVASLVTPYSGSSPLRPSEAEQLWVSKPTRVDVASQQMERLAPRLSTFAERDAKRAAERQTASATSTSATVSADAGGEISSADSSATLPSDSGATSQISPEQLAWCGNRYRSYDPQTNTYRAYSGETRTCAYPGASSTPAEQVVAQQDFAGGDAGHVAWCQSHYRSYDVSTDTYRAYSGDIRPCISPVSR